MLYETLVPSPLGDIRLRSDGEALTVLRFVGQRFDAPAPSAVVRDDLPVFAAARSWLAAYFSGQQLPPAPPLRPDGTAFRQRCWQLMQRIPPGQTRSYGALASVLHSSARAVGGAAAHNPILLIIPCHRIVGAGEQITGFAAGIERKIRLLAMEKGDQA